MNKFLNRFKKKSFAINIFLLVCSFFIASSCGGKSDNNASVNASPEMTLYKDYIYKKTFGDQILPPYSGTIYVHVFPPVSTEKYTDVQLYLDGVAIAVDDESSTESNNRFRFKWEIDTLSIGTHTLHVSGKHDDDIISTNVYTFTQTEVGFDGDTTDSTVAAAVVLAEGETAYDGSGDYYTSTNDSLKMAGYQTWCFSFKTNSVYSGQTVIDNSTVYNYNGINFYISYGYMYLQVGVNGYTRTAWYSGGYAANTWYNIVMVMSSTEICFYVDGVKCTYPVSTDGNVDTPISDFVIGAHKTGFNAFSPQYFNGSVKEVEIYSGAATNPTSWIPGSTGSLTGTTLVMQSRNGSGTDNVQGITFTKVGNPQITTQ
jgi:hypothetical protein